MTDVNSKIIITIILITMDTSYTTKKMIIKI
jgi:hypothetical protein